MYSNLKLLFTVVAGASVMLAGCSNDNDIPPVENLTVVEEGSVKPAQKAESTQPTAVLGSGGSISGLLSTTFTNIVEPDKAKHVIVACEDLDTYEAEIVAAYQRGIVITIVDPDAERVDEWCGVHGMVYPGDPTSDDNSFLISFNRKAVSMSVQKKDKEEVVEEDEVPLVIFTGWLDDILTPTLKGPDFRSKDIKKRFAPQRVSHVFPLNLSREILERNNWPLPENVSLSTTAELKCDIYPLHSFADNASFSGDFYAVEAELTIHNGNLYNGRWQYNRMAGLFEVCGFYLSEMSIRASLLEKGNNGLESADRQVVGGPAPASTIASASCQSGFEWKFDGWLTGGNGLESATPTPIQEGGWTWNNLTDNSVTGIKVDLGDNMTLWHLYIDGLPYDKNTPVPDLATGDLTFRCSWIWAVPQAVDDSTERYYMGVSIYPRYYWHWSALPDTKIEVDYIMPKGDQSYSFMLIPPSRKEGQRI